MKVPMGYNFYGVQGLFSLSFIFHNITLTGIYNQDASKL
jgi:hypothetical protein